MKETRITVPELILVAGTRVLLGFGAGLLLSDRFSDEQRKAVGWSLFAVGAITTIPLAIEVFGGRLSVSHPAGRDAARVGADMTQGMRVGASIEDVALADVSVAKRERQSSLDY